jgi:class 3 adenylate cyclase/tetratricopeptide (TPR) repeat protein
MPVCRSCGTENPEIARFCLACGTAIAEVAPAVRDEERRPITAVFIDLVGSTGRAEQLDPEDVLALLAPYYERLRTELERHGGSVEKFIGDAVVGLFGAPVAHEDDPERAVRASLAALEAIHRLNEDDPSRELRVRIGITTGEALVDLDARLQEGRGMAWGDTLNTAARLQSAAPVNGILVDERTRTTCGSAIVFREHSPVQAKGKTDPVPVWEAVEVAQAASGRDTAPLVGRDRELAAIGQLHSDVERTGRAALAVLVAEPGTGKSRLLREATARLDAVQISRGRCLSYGEGITYWPLAEMVRDLAGILTSDDDLALAGKLDRLVQRLPSDNADELRTIASAFAHLLGARETPRGTWSAAEISDAELRWGVRRALELLAAEGTVVVVVEDVHWAEPPLVALLESLLEADAPILTLMSARPEVAQTHPGLLSEAERRLVLALEPLDEMASVELARRLLAEAGADPEQAQRLVARARGNPLFLEETVRMLVEGDTDAADDSETAVPVTLQALVGARLDRLPSRERRLLQHASVGGVVFWSGIAALLDDSAAPVDQMLESLDERKVVFEHPGSSVAGEREWEFKHILLRDVAYGRLPKGRRVALHVRFADWLAGLPAGRDEFGEIVAYHLEQACVLAGELGHLETPPPFDRAARALAEAGRRAERREGLREARRYYERGLALARDDELRIELGLRRAVALGALGELDAAAEELADVAGHARMAESMELLCEALTALGNIALKQGRVSDARACLEEAAAVAAGLEDDRLRIRAAFERSALLGDFEGAVDEALAEVGHALELAGADVEPALAAEGHLRRGLLLVNAGRLAEAEIELTQSAAIAGETGSLRDDARAAAMLAYVKHQRGDAEAEPLALTALAWLERTEERYFQIQNFLLLGAISLEREGAAAAEEWLRMAHTLASEGGGWLVCEASHWLVEALVAQGSLEEAQQLAADAAAVAPPEDTYARAAVALADAALAQGLDDAERCLASYAEALALIADEEQIALDVGRTRIAYARALARFGAVERARKELSVARASLAAMGAGGHVAAADRELELLGSPLKAQ